MVNSGEYGHILMRDETNCNYTELAQDDLRQTNTNNRKGLSFRNEIRYLIQHLTVL